MKYFSQKYLLIIIYNYPDGSQEFETDRRAAKWNKKGLQNLKSRSQGLGYLGNFLELHRKTSMWIPIQILGRRFNWRRLTIWNSYFRENTIIKGSLSFNKVFYYSKVVEIEAYIEGN